jgi:tetratricopeptide (TPR) repeat protein
LRLQRAFAAVMVIIGLLAWTSQLRADPQRDFELAKSRYDSGRYEEAAELFAKLLKTPIDPKDPRRAQLTALYREARPWYAATLSGLGRYEEADAVFLEQLRADPFYELPPGLFPDSVTDRFIDVKARHRNEIERLKRRKQQQAQDEIERRERVRRARERRIRRLEEMAAYQEIVEVRERWIAALPLGIGQFYNESYVLGGVMATLQVGAIAATFGTAAVHRDKSEVFLPSCTGPPGLPRPSVVVDGGSKTVDCPGLESQLRTYQIANLSVFFGGLAVAIGGFIEAQISFKSEVVSRRKQDLPPPVPDDSEVEITPGAAITDDGASFGLSGRF